MILVLELHCKAWQLCSITIENYYYFTNIPYYSIMV